MIVSKHFCHSETNTLSVGPLIYHFQKVKISVDLLPNGSTDNELVNGQRTLCEALLDYAIFLGMNMVFCLQKIQYIDKGPFL